MLSLTLSSEETDTSTRAVTVLVHLPHGCYVYARYLCSGICGDSVNTNQTLRCYCNHNVVAHLLLFVSLGHSCIQACLLTLLHLPLNQELWFLYSSSYRCPSFPPKKIRPSGVLVVVVIMTSSEGARKCSRFTSFISALPLASLLMWTPTRAICTSNAAIQRASSRHQDCPGTSGQY